MFSTKEGQQTRRLPHARPSDRISRIPDQSRARRARLARRGESPTPRSSADAETIVWNPDDIRRWSDIQHPH